MMATTTEQERYLRVRRYVWPRRDGGPKTEYLRHGKWIGCANLAAARKVAERFGLQGIRIESK